MPPSTKISSFRVARNASFKMKKWNKFTFSFRNSYRRVDYLSSTNVVFSNSKTSFLSKYWNWNGINCSLDDLSPPKHVTAHSGTRARPRHTRICHLFDEIWSCTLRFACARLGWKHAALYRVRILFKKKWLRRKRHLVNLKQSRQFDIMTKIFDETAFSRTSLTEFRR